MKIGDSASLQKEFTENEVRIFSDLSLDKNPVHLDESYAQTTRFKSRIVHGFLAGSLISAVIGTKLPGPGSIYLSQTIIFKAPVYLGEKITATVTIEDIKKDKIFTLDTVCTNEKGETVLEGKATILRQPEGT